jgi:hypothetical protein
MPQDMLVEAEKAETIDDVVTSSAAELKRERRRMDFSQVLVWSDVDEAMKQFAALVEDPPLHSVVIHYEPKVAKRLLDLTNTKNRPLGGNHSERLAKEIKGGDYGLTGDTIKFSASGVMLDGQHRMKGCAMGSAAMVSHTVYGLDDDIFDIIDQGKKRTAADVLSLCGVTHAPLVAAAISWVRNIRERRTGHTGGGRLTVRDIKEAATGPMRDIAEWCNEAATVAEAYKQPPSLIAAVLFLIGKHSKPLATEFVQSWLYGPRTGRNKSFDMLQQRITTVRNQSGGSLNRFVNAAMVIQTFNNWHAGFAATARALTWNKNMPFPQLQFDRESFRAAREVGIREDTTLAAVQHRVLGALNELKDEAGNYEGGHPKLARESNVPERQIGYVVSTLVNEGLVHLAAAKRNGKGRGNDILRLRTAGVTRLNSYVME